MRFDAFHPWSLLGLLFLGIGGLGVVLPLLPTTPFVLLAAGCFARSSPRLHRWLLDSQLFGPILRDWEQHRCVPRRAKVVALVTMLGVGGSSILFAVPPGWPRWAGLALVTVGCGVLLSLRTCAADAGAAGRGLREPD